MEQTFCLQKTRLFHHTHGISGVCYTSCITLFTITCLGFSCILFRYSRTTSMKQVHHKWLKKGMHQP